MIDIIFNRINFFNQNVIHVIISQFYLIHIHKMFVLNQILYKKLKIVVYILMIGKIF